MDCIWFLIGLPIFATIISIFVVAKDLAHSRRLRSIKRSSLIK